MWMVGWVMGVSVLEYLRNYEILRDANGLGT